MALDALHRLQQALPENEEVDDKLEELTERNRELEAEVKSLKKQLSKLKAKGGNSSAPVAGTRRRTIGSRLGDSLVLHQASGQLGEYEESFSDYEDGEIEDDEYETRKFMIYTFVFAKGALSRFKLYCDVLVLKYMWLHIS